MEYIFGGDTGISYEQLQQRRKMVDHLRAHNARTPRNVGEGLQSVARALVARGVDRQNAEAEKQGRSQFDSAFNSLFGMGILDAVSPITSTSVTPASMPTGDMAKTIKDGLLQRGMPEHVADAFILNFQDESGLDPDIVEHTPNVHGTRGFGLYQLTGPRRTAYEAFAGQRGVDPSDVDAQLDWLVHELEGPESAAAQAIFAANDTGTAADAIVRKFLRPAAEHRESRSARYLGGATPNISGQNTGSPANSLGIDPRVLQLASSPWATPSQRAVVNALMQQQISANAPPSPMEQLQMQRAEIGLQRDQIELDRLRNPQPPERNIIKGADGFNYYQDTGERVLPNVQMPQGESTSIVSGERAAELGLDPAGSYNLTQGPEGISASRIGGQGTNVTVNTGQSEIGTIPQGYELITDPETRARSMRPIPGGPEDTTQEDALAAETKGQSALIVMDEIQLARDLIEGQSLTSPATGITGSLASNVESTRAGALKNRLETIKANIGFDKLQSMRDASPTGGALGQVSEFENRLLQAVYGSLVQAQDANQLLYNLNRLENIYERIIHQGIGDDEARELYNEIVAGADPQRAPTTTAPTAPEGIAAEDWQYMTPEERALFQ